MTMVMIEITDPYTRLVLGRFDGEQIGHSSTRDSTRRGQDRWTELRVWKLPDGTWKYAKYGLSVVYHTDPTGCLNTQGDQSGSPAVVDDLPDEAEPCTRCRPPAQEWLAAEADAGRRVAVRFEFPRVELTDCRSAAYLIRLAATKRDRVSGRLSVMMGGPARDLVAQCMADPDFRASAGDPAAVLEDARARR